MQIVSTACLAENGGAAKLWHCLAVAVLNLFLKAPGVWAQPAHNQRPQH
jgi:hypothetical protein